MYSFLCLNYYIKMMLAIHIFKIYFCMIKDAFNAFIKTCQITLFIVLNVKYFLILE